MSLKAAAQHLAAHGRNGDTTLVHMTPDEVRGLQQIAKQHGTSLTINPHTGMPEAFSLSGLVKAAAPIAAGYMLGPGGYELMTAGEAGLAVGAGTAALTGSLEKGLMAGLGAYGGAGLGGAAEKGIEKGVIEKQLADANIAQTANEIGTANAANIAPETKLTLSEAGKAGIKGIGALGGRDLATYGMAAAAPMLTEASKREVPGASAVNPGYIRPKYYDYRTQSYYDLPAVKSTDWGAQNIGEYRSQYAPVRAAEGGLMDQSPLVDEQELQYQNNPVVRMADGGATPAPTYTPFTQEQIGNYFTKNPDADVGAAIKQFNADPAAVNQYITGLSAAYKDPTATQAGTGYLPTYQNLLKSGMTADEFSAAAQANDKNWGTGDAYWNPTTVSHAYDVADKVLQFDPQTDKVTPPDKEWVKFMDSNDISVKDISLATGLSANEVQRRYDAAKEKPVVKPTVVTSAPAAPAVTTTPQTYAPTGAATPYGNAVNPGDVTINPDQSRTVTPNIPGRPYGGFTGLSQVRDAYTAGGGHLGQTLAPTRAYQNTGASADAYKYLMGEGPWQAPAAPVAPAAPTNPKWLIKDGMVVSNPDYVDPLLEKAKTTAAPTVDSANGGLMAAYAHGGETHLGDYSDGGRLLRGPGDGVSDSIPATIGGKQPARLADGEFVVPARIVSEIGNGSTEAGARKLYAMMDRVQAARRKTVGKGKVAKNTRADKYLPS